MTSENFNLEECQQQLKEFYLGPATEVQLLPWDPDHKVEMEAIFVNLEMMKDEVSPSQIKSIPIEKNEDLIKFETLNGSKVYRILILGDGGSGKSTLLANLAHKWALEKQNPLSPLSRFHVVFLINIHEIKSRKDTLENIIFNQILEHSQGVSPKSLKSYLKSHPERCLFLIDGLDEDHLEIFKDTSTEIFEVLSNKLFKKSCVIASTRAYKLKNMGRIQGQYTKVKLTGFSPQNIELYIEKFFTDYKDHGKELKEALKTHANLLDLAATPILLLLFCLLWSDPDPVKRSLPNTQTKLYKETIASLWKRYHCAKLGFSEDDLNGGELMTKLYDFLASLGKITLLGTVDQIVKVEKILFRESDFKEHDLLLALRLGILSRERIQSKVYTRTHVKFLHTSFQDFCSAIYLAKLSLENTLEFKAYMGKLISIPYTPWVHRATQVIEFCAGYRPETITLITEQFVISMHHSMHEVEQGRTQKLPGCQNLLIPSGPGPSQEIKDDLQELLALDEPCLKNTEIYHSYDLHFLFKLVFEAELTYHECVETVELLLSNSESHNFSISWISDVLATSIQYQLDLIKPIPWINNGLFFSTIRCIRFDEVSIEFPKFLPTFVSMLEYTKQVDACFLTFSFLLQPNEIGNIDILITALSNLKHLKQLRLSRSRDSEKEAGIVYISKSLHKLANLYEFSLQGITCTALNMASFLSLNKSLEQLSVWGTNEQNTVTRTNKIHRMMKAISTLSNLSVLILHQVKIGGAIKYLKSIIPQLHVLMLPNSNLGVWDMHKLAYFLGTAIKLQMLDLTDNFLGTAVNMLADQLRHMVKLTRLLLINTGLEDSHVCILVEGIKKMSLPCKIVLTENAEIGKEGRKAMDSLKSISHLQEIEILIEPMPFIEFVSSLYDSMCMLLTFGLSAIKAELPAMPNCRSCMSQIYHSVKCPYCNQQEI